MEAIGTRSGFEFVLMLGQRELDRGSLDEFDPAYALQVFMESGWAERLTMDQLDRVRVECVSEQSSLVVGQSVVGR